LFVPYSLFLVSELLRRKYDTFCSFFFVFSFRFSNISFSSFCQKIMVCCRVMAFRKIGSTIAHKSKSSLVMSSFYKWMRLEHVGFHWTNVFVSKLSVLDETILFLRTCTRCPRPISPSLTVDSSIHLITWGFLMSLIKFEYVFSLRKVSETLNNYQSISINIILKFAFIKILKS